MKLSLGDLFFGIIHLFVIVMPGSLVLAAAIYCEPRLGDAAKTISGTESVQLFLAVSLSYMLGHCISCCGQLLDRLNRKQRCNEFPELRCLVRAIVAETLPSSMTANGDIRRWASVILRQEESPSYIDTVRKSADRRFFRNMSVVLVVFLLLVIAGVVPERHGDPRHPAVLVTLIVLSFLSFARFFDQDRKYTKQIFESIIAAHPCKAVQTTPSVEFRCFGELPLPAFLNELCPEQLLASSDGRTDSYAAGITPDLGVKLREGRIEIKERLRREIIHLDGMAMPIEWWTKQTLAESATPPTTNEQAQWFRFPLHKRRWCKKFALSDSDPVKPVAAEEHVEGAGCQVEVTLLHEASEAEPTHWTFAFEAFGPPEQQLQALTVAVRHVIGKDSDKVRSLLKPDACCGYPQWIHDREAVRRKLRNRMSRSAKRIRKPFIYSK